jgi:hypothetical protein
MSAEAIRIINAAISVTTGNTITSVDDGTPEAIFADTSYEDMAKTALVRSRWKFNRKIEACTLLPDAPDSEIYGYAWQLPDDCIVLRTLTVNGCSIDYEIAEDGQVWTRCSDIPQAVYSFRAAEGIWPPDFLTAFRTQLEAGFLRLDERATEAKARDDAAEVMFRRAALVHSQEEAPHEHKHFPLIRARRTGHAPLRR